MSTNNNNGAPKNVVKFDAHPRSINRIADIREEYASNYRLLAYFAQHNAPERSTDNLGLLELALVRRQEMLVAQMANFEAQTLADICAKLEMWAQEQELEDGDAEADDQSRLVLSALRALKALSGET